MSEDAKALANRLEAFSREVVAFVEGCSPEAWAKTCAPEQWSVGVTARHIAEGHYEVLRLAQAVAAGRGLPPVTAEMLTEAANRHAREHSGCTKEEVLGLLRANGAALADFARRLPPSEIARTGRLTLMDADVTAPRLIELVVLESAREHFEHMKDAVG
ncbi:MAG: DinB family protein [Thermodesulfobacteriota bacterium]